MSRRGIKVAEHEGTFCRDMSQRHVATTHTRKCCGDMTQGHVAATRPPMCVHTFSFVQHESCYNFVPATCRTKFNLLNFVGHVAGTNLCRDAMSLRVHCCAARSCNRISISANHKQRPEYFALLHWEKKQLGGHG